MPAIVMSHVEVFVFRRRAGRVEFLCLRRSPGRSLAGVWQPVTGKLDPGERAVDAARRELLEETGLRPLRLWGLETVSLYFEAEPDRVRVLPIFAAMVDPRAAVRLSREHDAWRFASARAAGRLFLWEAQRRALAAVGREVLRGGRLAKALEVTTIPERNVTGKRGARAARGSRPRALPGSGSRESLED
jgi:8-oxo-dGTP pyrophosphatase MutT (NUDIX family)